MVTIRTSLIPERHRSAVLIASVGQRMIDGVARKIVQQFFDSAKAELASAKSAAAEPGSPRKSRGKAL